MESIKTKSNNYKLINGKAIAGIVLIPKNGQFIGYVAWEWETQAKQHQFAIIESASNINPLNSNWIDNIADYGNDVTHKKEIRKLFPQLF